MLIALKTLYTAHVQHKACTRMYERRVPSGGSRAELHERGAERHTSRVSQRRLVSVVKTYHWCGEESSLEAIIQQRGSGGPGVRFTCKAAHQERAHVFSHARAHGRRLCRRRDLEHERVLIGHLAIERPTPRRVAVKHLQQHAARGPHVALAPIAAPLDHL